MERCSSRMMSSTLGIEGEPIIALRAAGSTDLDQGDGTNARGTRRKERGIKEEGRGGRRPGRRRSAQQRGEIADFPRAQVFKAIQHIEQCPCPDFLVASG